jgi:hypothetical protein
MILKTLTHDHGCSDTWNYYDNIESASVYFDEGCGEKVVALKFKDTPDFITLVIADVAYLCNDDGKTIERLRPAEKLGDTEPEPFKVRVKCELVGE